VHRVLTAERKELLSSRLARDGRLVAKELARDLGISEDTIRRDLRELASEGRLQRVHGGALPASPAIAAFSTRQSIGVESKAAVARAAAALVRPGQTIAIDGGTTALQLVRSLDRALEATVVTHSPTIAVALVDHPGIEVLLLGGRLFKHSIVTCGAITAEAVRSMHADAFFMGVTGVHPEAGLTTGDAEEAAIKRALSQRCADTYVLASAEKIGAVSPHRVVALSEISAVITDPSADGRTVRALRRQRIDVRVARDGSRQ
jgi:DeoR/GlpR family transcriptional regulator of sugar metabolism